MIGPSFVLFDYYWCQTWSQKMTPDMASNIWFHQFIETRHGAKKLFQTNIFKLKKWFMGLIEPVIPYKMPQTRTFFDVLLWFMRFFFLWYGVFFFLDNLDNQISLRCVFAGDVLTFPLMERVKRLQILHIEYWLSVNRKGKMSPAKTQRNDIW